MCDLLQSPRYHWTNLLAIIIFTLIIILSADGLLLNLQALQELRESLKHKFESVDTDGGTPIVFELPNGEKLTYNFDMSCSTKVRNIVGPLTLHIIIIVIPTFFLQLQLSSMQSS